MKRREKRNLRLKYLLIILLLTAIVFISSTYAWFTSNKYVTIGSIEVEVKTVSGIQISVDGVTWKSAVTKEELLEAVTKDYAGSINTIPDVLEPVSTDLTLGTGDDAGLLNMYYGTVAAENDSTDTNFGEFKLTTEKDAPGSKCHYVVFDVFLKTQSAVDNLYLTTNSGVTFTDANSVGLENAVRIAFVKEGNASEGTDPLTIQGKTTTSQDDVYLWELNTTSHTAAGKSNAMSVYGKTEDDLKDALDYYGVATEIDEGVLLNDTTTGKFKLMSDSNINYYRTESVRDGNLKVFGLDAGITKLRIYMWVEGQDVDCENNASGANIKFDLNFAIDENTTVSNP